MNLMTNLTNLLRDSGLLINPATSNDPRNAHETINAAIRFLWETLRNFTNIGNLETFIIISLKNVGTLINDNQTSITGAIITIAGIALIAAAKRIYDDRKNRKDREVILFAPTSILSILAAPFRNVFNPQLNHTVGGFITFYIYNMSDPSGRFIEKVDIGCMRVDYGYCVIGYQMVNGINYRCLIIRADPHVLRIPLYFYVSAVPYIQEVLRITEIMPSVFSDDSGIVNTGPFQGGLVIANQYQSPDAMAIYIYQNNRTNIINHTRRFTWPSN